jgi:hypothetical protein
MLSVSYRTDGDFSFAAMKSVTMKFQESSDPAETGE